MNTGTFDIFALTTLLILAVAVPLLGMWDFQRLKRWLAEGRSDARTRSYRWIIGMEWLLALGFAVAWLLADRQWGALGLAPAADGWQWLALGMGLAGTAAVIGQAIVVLRSSDQLAKARAQIGDLESLVPQSQAEGRLFTVLSVTAGVCEEFLYRGVLLAVLTPALGLWPAVGVSSLIFGLGHAYQGVAGIGKTTLVGVVMALLTVFSGSLFMAMLLHSVIDLTSGRIMGAALQAGDAPAAPSLGADPGSQGA